MKRYTLLIFDFDVTFTAECRCGWKHVAKQMDKLQDMMRDHVVTCGGDDGTCDFKVLHHEDWHGVSRLRNSGLGKSHTFSGEKA